MSDNMKNPENSEVRELTTMQIQKLYMNWSTIKTEVVKAAAEFLADPQNNMAKMTLNAMLVAEKDAHEAFRTAMQRKDRRFEW